MKPTKEAPVEATVIVNRLGTVEDVDDAACALLGYSREELLGLHGSDLIPADAQPATAVAIDRMLLGEIPLQRHGRVRRKDGSVLGVDVRTQILPNERLAFSLRKR